MTCDRRASTPPQPDEQQPEWLELLDVDVRPMTLTEAWDVARQLDDEVNGTQP